jgi:hypothetical protein
MAMQSGQTRGPYAVISAAEQLDGRVGVGVVLKGRGGVSLEKLSYVAEAGHREEALYRALVEALGDAVDRNLRGLTVLVEDPRLVSELNRETPVPEALQPLFVQIRCRANSLWPARFEVAKPTQAFGARQLAQDALLHGPVRHTPGVMPLLPLGFSEDRAA